MKLPIEEHVETLHTNAKEACETKMSALVEQNEKTKAADELQCFDTYKLKIHIYYERGHSIQGAPFLFSSRRVLIITIPQPLGVPQHRRRGSPQEWAS